MHKTALRTPKISPKTGFFRNCALRVRGLAEKIDEKAFRPRLNFDEIQNRYVDACLGSKSISGLLNGPILKGGCQ